MKRMICVLVWMMLAALLIPASIAETAQDITLSIGISSENREMDALYDRLYTDFWRTKERKNPYIDFSVPEGMTAQYLYVCFGDMPESWAIQEEINGEWVDVIEGPKDYHHVVIDLGGRNRFRMTETSGEVCRMKINDLFVFSEGDLPEWVQQWEPTPDKADLLVVTAHTGDEVTAFGGALPTYAGENKMNVIVACMTYSNTTRRSELLNSLWALGVRTYPVIGEYYDAYTNSLEKAYSKWRKQDVRDEMTELIRRYQPDVILTHAVNGEKGHGAHRLCADVLQYVVPRVSQKTFHPESVEKYGTWEVKKLYLHLYEENQIQLNWDAPLAAFGGKTGLEVAKEAVKLHVTQENDNLEVSTEGRTDCTRFGLAYTTVGQDIAGDSFFENVRDASGARITPVPTPVPTPTPQPIKVPCDVEWPEQVPSTELDAKGYPVSGEHVYADYDLGLWFYASPTLVVRIDRIFDPEAVLTWYEAHIYCDLAQEQVGSILYDPEHPQKTHVQTALIARQNQVVFGMNTDYYTYRIGRKTITGMVIRDRNVFFDRVPEANRSQFPNLDTLAMYENGSWQVYHSDELTADEYLAKGAVDVYSFGPYLVRDGEINPFIAKMTNGKTPQPRVAIGMIEPGHYYAMLAEGRIKNKSVGVSIEHMANHMLDAGCVQALNLDGGQTAVMSFMGDQVTRIGKYSGGRTNPRATTEIIGVGHSDLIDPNAKPFYPEP